MGIPFDSYFRLDALAEGITYRQLTMFALLCFVLAVLTSPFKSKSRLEAENMALRHQLNVLRRKVRGRVWLTNNDRWFFVQLYRWFPSILQVLTVVRPRRSCIGTGPAFAATGAGSHARWEGGRRSRRISAC